jgi:hypothetical protein
MSLAQLPPEIKALPAAERLRLARDIIAFTLETNALGSDFPIEPTQELLELAGIAKGPVQVHARDHAEDEQLDQNP